MLSEEWHILGDLNINLYQNGSTLGEENKNIIKGANKVSSKTNKYLEFCKTFGLQQFYFFNWDSLHASLNSHYEAWIYKKRSTKKITGYRKSV